MNKWKIGGIVAVIVGSASLYIGGAGETAAQAIVGAVFILAGIIAGILKKG